MCLLQNSTPYEKRRLILNKYFIENNIKKIKNLCTCKEQVTQKHKLTHKVLLHRLNILSNSKENNNLMGERKENVKVMTYLDISLDDLPEEKISKSLNKRRKKKSNYIQTSNPNTTIVNSSGNCTVTTDTFCNQRITHQDVSEEETEDNAKRKKTKDTTYIEASNSSYDSRTVTFVSDEKLPDIQLEIQDSKSKEFVSLLQYMRKKVDLKEIDIMSGKEFNVLIIIENQNLLSTDIIITDRHNNIVELATVPYNNYSYIYDLYRNNNESRNVNSNKLCCNVLRLQCCCWHKRQEQIELRFPEDFKKFLYIPHSCLNSCSCCCNGNRKEVVAWKIKHETEMNDSTTDITTHIQTIPKIEIVVIQPNSLQAKALAFKKPKYKQCPISHTNSTGTYSTLSLQFHFKTKSHGVTSLNKQMVETLSFGVKGEILFHDYNIETNSMYLTCINIKYVILTESIISDNICCKYKYEMVLDKLKLVFKIDPNLLSYIRKRHKGSLSFYLDVCKDCKILCNSPQSMDLTKNRLFKYYGSKVNMPIEHTRKAIMSGTVKPNLVTQQSHHRQMEISRNDVPINIVELSVPTWSYNPNKTANSTMSMQMESSKGTQTKSHFETASYSSILQGIRENHPGGEILPTISQVYSLNQSSVEDIDTQVNVKSEMDVDEHETITGF